MSCTDFIYWEVQPELIRLSKTSFEQVIPLSFRGQVESPLCFSSNPDVATVDENMCVRAGRASGRSMIGIWRDDSRSSLRYVTVEVGSCDSSGTGSGGGSTIPTQVAVNGSVSNSTTGAPISSGTITVSNGGVIQQTQITNGSYQLNLQPGTYSIQASSDGYQNYSGTLVVGQSSISGASIQMQPAETLAGLAIITLEWNDPSLQLEAHLTGPRAGGGAQYHIYHDHLEEAGEAKLTRYAGARRQQIQVFRYNHDQYRFYVHNLGARFENPSYSLGNSGARVTIQTPNGTQQYQVPTGSGNLWRMLEIDGNTGQVHAINALGYLTDPTQQGM